MAKFKEGQMVRCTKRSIHGGVTPGKLHRVGESVAGGYKIVILKNRGDHMRYAKLLFEPVNNTVISVLRHVRGAP